MQGSDKPYAVGKGKPPLHSRFQRGESGNPKGKTAATKRLELSNAEKAMVLRERLLDALTGVMLEDPTKETLVEKFIKADILKLLKDSEDRGLGAPVQAVINPDGSLRPTVVELVAQPIPQGQGDD